MKRTLCLLLCLALFLGLAACGKTPEPEERDADLVSYADAPGVWTGTGGCYALRSAELPENASPFLVCGEIWYLIQDWDHCELLRGNETVYSFPKDTLPLGLGPVSDGVWLAQEQRTEQNRFEVTLLLLDLDGGVRRELALKELYETDAFFRGFQGSDKGLFLLSSEELIALSPEGTLLGTLPMTDYNTDTVLDGSGDLYLIREDGEGLGVYTPDFSGGGDTLRFRLPAGELHPGDAEAPFLLKTDEGLFRVAEDGGLQPVVLWEECSIPSGGLYQFLPLGGGIYYCTVGLFAPAAKLLVPVEPSEIRPRIKLQMAGIASRELAEQYTLPFNLWSEEYYIEYTDYSDDGTLPPDQALLKLNTQIVGGQVPDLLFLSRLSPAPYIGKELLADLTPFFDNDPELSLEDLSVLKPLQTDGGIYVLGSDIFLETRMGRESDFGEVFGWSIAQYLDFERRLPENVWTMYNITAKSFLHTLTSRYARSAIDWSTGTCDFDNPEFRAILEAAKRIRENPEDPNDMRFGNGILWVAEGSMLVDMVMMGDFTAWAENEAVAGCRLSVVGQPTPDGSCGTDLNMDSYSMFRQSSCPEGCWAFLKYRLTHPHNNPTGICLYKPILEHRMADAMADETIPFTDSDRQRFLSLLDAIEYPDFYDSTVLDIVDQETAAFLAGDRSAEGTARLIQSRLSLYISEQS